MTEWVNHILNSGQAGITALVAVFLMGMISVFTCACNYAVIGVVAGYTGAIGSTGRRKAVIWSGAFFLIGTMVSMAIVGTIIGFASEMMSVSFGNYWKIAAGLISILFGLYTIDLLPFKIPGFSFKPESNKSGILAAIIFGFAVGGLSTAGSLCCNPFFPIVMAATFVKGSTLWGLMLLVVFSFGFGLPLSAAMIGIGLGFGKISKTMAKVGTVIKYAGGIALIALGFYFLLTI